MKKKILLTDDDPEMRSEVSEILSDEGYDVRTAVNGLAAMELIKKETFDLLILDLKMPLKTGYEVLKYMDDELIRIKTIVLTGSILGQAQSGVDWLISEEKTRLLQLADTVMNKPFDMDILLEKIKHHIS